MGRQFRVLVADDFEDTRLVYAEALRDHGFAVDLACDGREAVSLALAKSPDAIVMDLAMPVIDGFTATRTLKADPTTRGIWILAVTGHAERHFIDRAYAASVDAIMLKPCSPLDVVARVKTQASHMLRRRA